MTVNTTNITGFVVLPNDTIREKSSIIFRMTGFDTDADQDAVVVPYPITAPIAVDGSIDVDLWPNAEGIRTTFYQVTASLYNGVNPVLVDLGRISVPVTGGPFDMNDLLPVSPPSGASVDDYIAFLAAAVASAEDAADRAEAAAASAEIYAAGRITPEAYGAVGDGVTNDTTAMQSFFAAIEGRIGSFLPDAKYVINSRIFPPRKNWKLEANGATVDFSGMPNGDGDAAGSFLSINGIAGTPISISSITSDEDIFNLFTTTVETSSAHGLSVGDECLISSDDVIDVGHDLTQETRGQFVRVETVESATVFTTTQTIYEALTTNPVMTPYDWAENVQIEGKLNIIGPGRRPTTIGYSGLAFTYARDCSVEALSTDGVDYQCFVRDTCLRVNAGDLVFKFDVKGANTQIQYGDTYKNASTDCHTGTIIGYGGKHLFDWTRNTNPGIGRHCTVGPITGYDTWDAMAATHGNCRDLTFSTMRGYNCLYVFGNRVAGVAVGDIYGQNCSEVLKLTDDARDMYVASVRGKNVNYVIRAKDPTWIGTLESRNINIGRVDGENVAISTLSLDYSDIPVFTQADAAVTGGTSNTITLGEFPVDMYNAGGVLTGSEITMDWDGAGGGTPQTRTITGHTFSGVTNTITVSGWTTNPVAGTSTYFIRSFVDDINVGNIISKNCVGADVALNGNFRRLVTGDIDVISEAVNANPSVLIQATATTYPDVVNFGLLRSFQKGVPAVSGFAQNVTFDVNAASDAVLKTGSTMTGPLLLNADPTADLGAATKGYVDDRTGEVRTLRSFGAVGNLTQNADGTVFSGTDDTTALQAAVDWMRVAPGRVLDGEGRTYLTTGTVGGIGHFRMRNARIGKTTSGRIIYARAEITGPYALATSYTAGDLSIDLTGSPLPFAPRAGQPFKILSDAVDPANRDEGSSPDQPRVGEWFVAGEGSTTENIVLQSPLVLTEGVEPDLPPPDGTPLVDEAIIAPYTTGMNALILMPDMSARCETDIEVFYEEGNEATFSGDAMRLEGYCFAEITPRVSKTYGSGVSVAGYRPRLTGGFVRNGEDDRGYGISDNSCHAMVVDGVEGFNTRHVYSSSASFGPTSTTDPYLLIGRGRSMYAEVSGYGSGGTQSVWDTHHQSDYAKLNVTASNCGGNAVNVRGRNVDVRLKGQNLGKGTSFITEFAAGSPADDLFTGGKAARFFTSGRLIDPNYATFGDVIINQHAFLEVCGNGKLESTSHVLLNQIGGQTRFTGVHYFKVTGQSAPASNSVFNVADVHPAANGVFPNDEAVVYIDGAVFVDADAGPLGLDLCKLEANSRLIVRGLLEVRVPDASSSLINGANSPEVEGAGVIRYYEGGVLAQEISIRREVYPEDFGAFSDGTNDDSHALERAMQYSIDNERKFVARGDYTLLSQVTLNYTNNLDFDLTGARCTAGAGFPGSGAKMFSIVGATGTDLTFNFIGGHFNVENMPSEGELSSNDAFNISVGVSASIVKFHIESLIAGDDWRSGGSDSGVFINGDNLDIHVGYCRGFADLGVYLTSSSTAAPARKRVAKVRGTFENCQRAVSAKRGFEFVDVDIMTTNCVSGWTASPAEVDALTPAVSTFGGTVNVIAERCQWPVNDARGSGIRYNVAAYRMGAYLAETSLGAADGFASTEARCRFQGTKNAFGFLSVHGVNPDVVSALGGGYLAGNYGAVEFEEHVGTSDTIQATRNTFYVHTTGMGRVVFEQNSSDFNTVISTGDIVNSIIVGANSVIQAVRSYSALLSFGGTDLTLTQNNNGGPALNVLKFKDTDGSSVVNQEIGRIDFETSDVDSPGIAAFIKAITGNSSGGGQLLIGAGNGGAAATVVTIAGGRIIFEQPTIHTPYTVATLPAPSNGLRAYVTDSSVAYSNASVGTTVVGGGSGTCPVVVAGGTWKIG